MNRIRCSQFQFGMAIVILSSFIAGCSTQASSKYFGQTVAPKNNVLRYITGSEPESLDPYTTDSSSTIR
jgi:ABC-type oligopeptide transport system substrate-binding subunit